MKLTDRNPKPKLVVRESVNPAAVLKALRESGGNITEVAEKLGYPRTEIAGVVKRGGFDKLIEDEFLDELESRVLKASLGQYVDPKFNPVTAISVLAKRRPEKWSGRKSVATTQSQLPPAQKPDSKHTPHWKKRADALRIKYAAIEPAIREPARGADGSLLSENPGREIVEPDDSRGIREPD